MKSIEEQLARYKSVHLNQKNINTHFVGVPLIVLAVTLMLSTIGFEIKVDDVLSAPFTLEFTLAMVIFAVIAIYYLFLHRLLALGMLVYIAVNLFVAHLFSGIDNLFYMAIGLFVIGWIIQFVGHHYEKAKPAFVDDLSQFLIGPLFLMAEVYFMLGLEPVLKAHITSLAVEKRKALEQQKRAK
ncbi:MAG: DUF962 domain-containing protein [Colwellia sp.]|uniref:Mpo1 family 2-hydroxy fatty acid dioxygenase n=1 Tax=Colwellia sp. TaxID=56799 RepID=UPI001DABD97C|nr:Mpo1-like protein [Colwellia sp.]NQZ25527.1 DUF962 domain-containing protein [Colwellia sp.]NRA89384.1 DUF962 domain-containing protein [Hyphomicrobiales bacterium]